MIQLETELIDRAKQKDAQAFETLMSPYEGRVYATCLRLMGNEQDAADQMQEAMLRVWRTLHSFAAQSSFATWMYRVTTNVCLDALRKRKAGRSVSLDAMREGAGFDPGDEGPGPEAQVEQSARRQALRQAMRDLSPELLSAFVLRDLQGQSYDQVAQALRISLGTAKSRIHRARAQLAKRLRESGELFPQNSVQREEGRE